MPHNETGRFDWRPASSDRVAWFDTAKGICIVLVVMMHSTLGVGEAFAAAGLAGEGFMHWIVAYAKPFRMPDFFLLSGLFLSFAITRTWPHYLDKKVVHFAYFYLLWTALQAIVRLAAARELTPDNFIGELAYAVVHPYPTLWFIYVLPLMFVATKLLRGVPAWVLLTGATLLKLAPINTGWVVLDHQIADYYIYFLAGYFGAPYIFRLADWATANARTALALIVAWGTANGVLAFSQSPMPIAQAQSLAELPGLAIILGLTGAVALVSLSSLITPSRLAAPLAFCGRHSLIIYAAFTIPMALSRTVLVKSELITDTGLASLIVWLTAVACPLLLYVAVRATPARLLFERPDWAKLPYRTGRDGRAPAARTQPTV